jgi:predicted nucleic acid-binding protein
MNVVDTSGWLEYFTGGNNSGIFAEPIMEEARLLVPTICIYEISKVILRERNEHDLIQALAAIHKGRIISLSPSLSTAAAKVSLEFKLPMADSIIYATALQFNAFVWTQDGDFKDLPNVRYIPKPACQ